MRTKRIIPVLFILILSLFPIPPFVESAGYGEENENLGQFTDDFENDNNVSIAFNVINNQTLDCMELNYTVGTSNYENFSKYTEIDPGGDITITDKRITWSSMIRNVADYVYEDYGVANFGDFEFQFTYVLTDVEAGDGSNQNFMSFVAFANHFGALNPIVGKDWLACVAQQSAATDDKFRFRLGQYTGGANDFFAQGGIRDLGTYYLTFDRSGTNIRLRIYSDSARTALIETLTDGGNGDNTAYRYLHGIQSWNSLSDPNDHSTGYIEYLWNGSLTGGFEDEGYFITEDYLNYTTGNSLALLTNTSIPVGTSMTVQFSNDDATWVDNEGNIGSTTILDGFYAIDLRDLNYSDSFKMYNLSTSDSTITPRLYQSRLITTNGTAGAEPGAIVIQNVTGEWIDHNLTEIDVLIGVHDSGDVNSTLDIDGDTYNCSEVVGAPGYRISFNWTNVDQESHCLWVVAYVYYDGNQAHDIHIELWNFTSTTWVEIGTINDAVDFGWVNSSIYDLRMPNDFINSTGAVLGRLDHVAAGNINHDIHIEFLKLQAFIPFEAGAVTEQSFFWVFIAIVLSIIVGLLMWLKYEHNNN